MERCRRMKRQRCMSKNWTHSCPWKSSIKRSESFGMKTDILMNGSMVKNHISLKRNSDTLHNGKLRSYFGSRLSNSSGSDSSTSRTLSRQGSHCSTFSPSSSSSPTISEMKTREREDRTESDISPVTVNYFCWWKIGTTRYWPSQ